MHQPPDQPAGLPVEIIKSAPDNVPELADPYSIPSDHPLWTLITDLQVENATLQAENERLSAETDPEIVKARLLRPYANRIYGFVVVYALVILALLVLAGFKIGGFSLPESVLTVLTGTSLLAVLGLVGTVASGLFLRASK